MKINRNNYESYFIDYLDSNLDKKREKDFLNFLRQNPDLEEELFLARPVSFPDENISFEKKNTLYKDIYDSEQEFNHAAIALLEGDLSAQEKSKFKYYLNKHPQKKKEAELFKKTKLIPDLSITLKKKNKLHRASISKSIILWTIRIAAVVIMAFILYIQLPNKNTGKNCREQAQFAIKNKETQKSNRIPPKVAEVSTLWNQKKGRAQVAATGDKRPAISSRKKPLRQTNNLQKPEEMPMRIPASVPPEINRLTASFKISPGEIELAYIYPKTIAFSEYETTRTVLKFPVNKIKRAGLKLISNYTKNNLSYKTGKGGKITEINYDSRLLAFSIPTCKGKKGDK